jgi:thioredoxin 2
VSNAVSRATVECPSCGRANRVDLARAGDGPKCGACGEGLALDRPLPVTERGFDRMVADAPVPVLVDFHADWCGPCRMMAPVLEQVARERQGRVLVAKVDTERSPGLAQRFRIVSIPTVMVFRGGASVARQEGALAKPRLDALLDAALA